MFATGSELRSNWHTKLTAGQDIGGGWAQRAAGWRGDRPGAGMPAQEQPGGQLSSRFHCRRVLQGQRLEAPHRLGSCGQMCELAARNDKMRALLGALVGVGVVVIAGVLYLYVRWMPPGYD